MAVTRARLNSYRSSLGAYGDAAAAYVERYLAAIMAEYPGISVAEARDAAIEAIGDALNAFGDQAAELALALFEEVAGTGYDAKIYDVIDPDAVDSKVRYYARSLVEGDVSSFSRDVTDLTRYYVKRSAFENMAENCGRGEVRYARVPSGSETCPFCFMLSSRGFEYHTAESAGEGHPYHRNCDCVIVPGVKGLDPDSQVEGYRPTELYRRWKGCAGTVGEDPDTGDAAALKRIRAEVATRDWRWLYEGRVPSYEIEPGAKPKPGEIETAMRLSEHGYKSRFRKTRSSEGKRTSDVFFLSGSQESPTLTQWEFKGPKGNGKQTIHHQFEEAAGQSHNVVVDCTNLGEYWTDRLIVAEVDRKLGRGFTVERGEHKGENWLFDEAIVIFRDGSILKRKRG